MKRLRLLLILLPFLPLSAKSADSTAVVPRDIIHTQWFSHTENLFRRVDIYLPAAYDTCTRPLPVLYLIHGINGYEGAWQERGDATDSLEKLIAETRCEPVIFVMPDCDLWVQKEGENFQGNIWRCLFHYGELSHEHIIEYALSDLMDMIDSTYSTSTNCAVAGLSDGARMSANIANLRPDRIHHVGLFSPVVRKEQLPKDTTQVISIFAGKNDMFFHNADHLNRRLNKTSQPHQFIVLNGCHNWKMWRRCLSRFLELWAGDPNSRSDSEHR